MAPTRPSPPHLVGHGALLIPRAGFRLEHVEGAADSTVRVTYGDESALLDVRAPDASASPLAEVLPGPQTRAWRIETTSYVCALPLGFVLADDPDGFSPFVLDGPEGALVWVSGPMPRDRALPVENLIDEGQTVRGVADAGDNVRVDLDYVFEGEPWWQRRYILAWGKDDVLVLSAQARALDEDTVRVAIDGLVETIAPSQLN